MHIMDGLARRAHLTGTTRMVSCGHACPVLCMAVTIRRCPSLNADLWCNHRSPDPEIDA